MPWRQATATAHLPTVAWPRPYNAWSYPVIPALFVLGTLIVVANSLYAQIWSTVASILITLVGVPLYYLWLWWQRRYQQAPST